MGQTLAYWGVGSGPYLVPISALVIYETSAVALATGPEPSQLARRGGVTEFMVVDGIQTRAQLPMELKSVGDPYVVMRSAYEQRRRYEINDGIVVDLFLEDPFMDETSSAQ